MKTIKLKLGLDTHFPEKREIKKRNALCKNLQRMRITNSLTSAQDSKREFNAIFDSIFIRNGENRSKQILMKQHMI